MTSADRMDQLSKDEFAMMWNGADNLDEVVAKVMAKVGRVPRWAVLARAVALRKEGVALKPHGPSRP